MKGKAESQPTNHVVWANGFKSNMPDWPTARRVSVSDRLLYLCQECRTLFFEVERTAIDTQVFQIMKDPRWNVLFESLQEVIGYASTGIEIEERKPMPVPPNFPKPPGF